MESARKTGPLVQTLSLLAVVMTGVFASAVLGAITTAINGWVSPYYFVVVLRWDHVEDVWRAAIAQGTFEGILFGVVFSLIFTTGMGIITRVSCSYRFAVQHLLGILAGAWVCWTIGGMMAVGLATFSQEFYRQTFPWVPEEFGPMLAYAWVGGSIWGVEIGGFVSVVLSLVVLRANWLRLTESEPEVSPAAARE